RLLVVQRCERPGSCEHTFDSSGAVGVQQSMVLRCRVESGDSLQEAVVVDDEALGIERYVRLERPRRVTHDPGSEWLVALLAASSPELRDGDELHHVVACRTGG